MLRGRRSNTHFISCVARAGRVPLCYELSLFAIYMPRLQLSKQFELSAFNLWEQVRSSFSARGISDPFFVEWNIRWTTQFWVIRLCMYFYWLRQLIELRLWSVFTHLYWISHINPFNWMACFLSIWNQWDSFQWVWRFVNPCYKVSDACFNHFTEWTSSEPCLFSEAFLIHLYWLRQCWAIFIEWSMLFHFGQVVRLWITLLNQVYLSVLFEATLLIFTLLNNFIDCGWTLESLFLIAKVWAIFIHFVGCCRGRSTTSEACRGACLCVCVCVCSLQLDIMRARAPPVWSS